MPLAQFSFCSLAMPVRWMLDINFGGSETPFGYGVCVNLVSGGAGLIDGLVVDRELLDQAIDAVGFGVVELGDLEGLALETHVIVG